MNIAFKVTYNDGGQSRDRLGFRGVCSDQTIKLNTIIKPRVNCSREDNVCRIYADDGFKGARPNWEEEDQCYEGGLFSEWKFGAGKYHHGPKKGEPISISDVQPGDIAILTTVFPGFEEKDRKIIGLFKIEKIKTTEEDGHLLVADKESTLELGREISEQLNFWDFYQSSTGVPQWKEGLFRYLRPKNVDVEDLLDSIYQVTNDNHSKKLLEKLKKIPPKTSTETKAGKSFIHNVITGRKYGLGGEGEDHKALKHWIRDHPEFLGLKDVTKVEEEPVGLFPTNDVPDIVIECRNGVSVAVEIETKYPGPGSYQALKYKALLSGMKNLPLNSKNVRSFLVAWTIPEEVKQFCDFYEITTRVKRV